MTTPSPHISPETRSIAGPLIRQRIFLSLRGPLKYSGWPPRLYSAPSENPLTNQWPSHWISRGRPGILVRNAG